MTQPPLIYRPEIDGLRALAVLPVMLFHLGLPGIPGGFVGVDVFFVISGYLISSILIAELSAGAFSIARFYERRIRRIFPALLVMLAFVVIVAPLALLPSEFETLWQELLGAVLFVANFVFRSQSDYFSADAHEKPLLHTWSLGVEEQFYILAPLLLWAVLTYAPRYRRAIVLALFVASLVASIHLTRTEPDDAFYMLHTRAWELMAGTLLALGVPGRLRSRKAREAAALVGLAALLIAVFSYSAAMEFPGALALLPVLGAALILHSAEGTAVGALLSRRPAVFVGKLSYSLYLWHWPLIVFARDWGWMDGVLGQAGVLAASFAAAWLSWRLVEQTTRDRLALPTPRLLRGVGLGAAGIVAICILYSQLGGWPSRWPADLRGYDMARNDFSPSRKRCHTGDGTPDPAAACVLGDGPGPERVLLWGDSHGVELAQAIAEAGVETRAITYSSCPPVLGQERDSRPECREHNDEVLAYVLARPEIGTVILAAYFNGDPEKYAGVARTADALLAAGKTVFVIGPTPAPGGNVPTRLALGGAASYVFKGPDRAEVARHFDPQVKLVLPSDLLCKDGTCSLLSGGAPVLFDDNHPSMAAARLIADRLVAMMPPGLSAAQAQP